jgi:hypothetical protein
MTRVLQPELLDELPADDPRAIHSRRDLRRLNALMGNGRIIAKFIRAALRERRSAGESLVIAEIGAGEGLIGSFVAKQLRDDGYGGELLLVDRVTLGNGSIDGWETRAIQADVFEWFEQAPRVDVVIANLFLHHFTDKKVKALLERCAGLCDCFAAAEPLRSPMGAWFSRRVGLIGCNEITRHDAEISVRAGFAGNELSGLWPRSTEWRLTEQREGLFTHFLGAVRHT